MQRTERFDGDRARQIRRKKGLLQGWVAGQLGWKQSRLSEIERGNIRRVAVEDARALARVLDVTLDDLLTTD